MKGLIVNEDGSLRLADDLPVPEIGPYEALVKTECCMICNGTDLEIIKGDLPEASKFPLVLGHESAGRVVATGNKVSAYRVGDRVIRSALPDSDKYYSAWGGFAEYGIVTDASAMEKDGMICKQGLTQQVVPEDISAEQAALMITLKETASAVERIGIGPDDQILIVGDGPVGLCFLSALRISGIKNVAMLGNRKTSLSVASQIGAETYWNHDEKEKEKLEERLAGRITVYIDTIGSGATISQGMKYIAPDGKIAVYGLRTGDKLGLDMRGMRNFSLQFVQWPLEEREMLVHDRIVQAIRDRSLNTDILISHVLPIEEFREGFDAIIQKRALKVALKFTE